MTSIELEIIESTSDSVRAVTKSNDPNRQRTRKTMMILIFAFAIAIAVLVSAYAYSTFKHFVGDDSYLYQDLESYIFSNTSVVISHDTDSSIGGGFIVNGTHYEFIADFHSLSFIEVSSEPIGFIVEDHNASDPVFVLEYLHQNGTVYSTEVTPSEPANVSVIDLLMHSVLMAHFVELSAKLAGAGYIGTRGQHLADLHRFAQWMYQYKMRTIQSMSYDDLYTFELLGNMTEEFEKVNAIVTASANAGHWVTSMDELVSYTSSEYTPSRSGSRRGLLGNCGAPTSQCGNDCFGTCGIDCACWSWICGDCGCWEGCRQHDHYCSCEGALDYCCIDVFWIQCDGNSTDTICAFQ